MYNKELKGVIQAIELASLIAKPRQTYDIYSDNQAGIYRLKTPSDNPRQACQIRAINASNIAKEKGALITLNWVPGHLDILGNEEADKLAKLATKIAPSLKQTSYAVLGQRAKLASRLE